MPIAAQVVATVNRGPALLAAIGVLVVAGAAGALLFTLRAPDPIAVTSSTEVPDGQPTDGATSPTAAPGQDPTQTDPGQADPAAPSSAPTEVADPVVASAVFEDAWVEEAMQQAVASPSQALPSQDAIATALINEEIRSGGYDLTGMTLTIYPDGPIPSFLLAETNDDSALIAADVAVEGDDSGEDFLLDLLTAQAITDFQVETFVMQHTGVDEVGPYVLTLTIPFEKLNSALAAGTDLDFTDVRAQLERPG